MKSVLVVDDTEMNLRLLGVMLDSWGLEVTAEQTFEGALKQIKKRDFDLYILDIQMPVPKRYSASVAAGKLAGYVLWDAIRQKDPLTHVIFASAGEPELLGDAKTDPRAHFLRKPVNRSELQRRINSFEDGLGALRVFVVHGRDSQALTELELFLARLGVKEPVILRRILGENSTVIEKLEYTAETADACVVLITADDIGRLKQDSKDNARMRQNVLFELGYFLGKFGRKSGRVLVFTVGEVEMPSDLSGVDFVRVREGFGKIEAHVVEQVRGALLKRR